MCMYNKHVGNFTHGTLGHVIDIDMSFKNLILVKLRAINWKEPAITEYKNITYLCPQVSLCLYHIFNFAKNICYHNFEMFIAENLRPD